MLLELKIGQDKTDAYANFIVKATYFTWKQDKRRATYLHIYVLCESCEYDVNP